MMRPDSFSARVFGMIQESGPSGIKSADLAYQLGRKYHIGLGSAAEKRKLYSAVKDLVKSGRVERLAPGHYRPQRVRPKQPKRRCMESILINRNKAGKPTGVDDLIAMCGASEEYAKEFFRALLHHKLVRCLKTGKYRLIEDLIKLPPDLFGEKARYLREFRRAKKAALAAATELQKLMAAIPEPPEEPI